ncbi:MAG: hypothetical protein IKA02_02890 [Clostridia bacterium]|nr:hypothetical protein [Clostridia bacterium]
MKKKLRTILSISLLMIVLFVAFFYIMEPHNCCDKAFCLQCVFIRNVNDGIFTLVLLLVSSTLIVRFIISRLAYILIEYKGRILSLTKLGIKLRD